MPTMDGTYSGMVGLAGPSNPKAAEAQLLSQATNTATVAARSILLSGGSEEVALKTAKAAAQSVLIPMQNDGETFSTRSTTFLRRRKAKRQAEVVASMALMTAASNVRSGTNPEWDTLTTSTDPIQRPNGSTRNFSARSLQDETSVISGLTRPPKVPTPSSVGPRKAPKGKTETSAFPFIDTKRTPQTPPSTDASGTPDVDRTAKVATTPSPLAMDTVDDRKTRPVPQNVENSGGSEKMSILDKIRSRNREEEVQGISFDGPIYSNQTLDSEEPEAPPVDDDDDEINSVSNDDEVEVEDDNDDDDDDDEEEEEEASLDTENEENARSKFRRKSRKGRNDSTKRFILKHLDPLLVSFTNTLNNFSCGPLSTYADESNSSGSERRSKKKKKSSRHFAVDDDEDDEDDDDEFEGESCEDRDVLSGGDTETDIEERDDTDNDIRGGDSTDQSDIIKERFSSSSDSTDSSVDSSQLLRELDSCSSEEGEIQVRSSIRDTMEKIVSKSHMGMMQEDTNVDRTWLSYELRQDDGPEMLASAARTAKKTKKTSSSSKGNNSKKSKKSRPMTPSKKNFFWKKKTTAAF